MSIYRHPDRTGQAIMVRSMREPAMPGSSSGVGASAGVSPPQSPQSPQLAADVSLRRPAVLLSLVLAALPVADGAGGLGMVPLAPLAPHVVPSSVREEAMVLEWPRGDDGAVEPIDWFEVQHREMGSSEEQGWTTADNGDAVGAPLNARREGQHEVQVTHEIHERGCC